MISVIIPSYRNPKCLDICIESALRGLESILQEMKSEGIKSTTETNVGYGYSPLDDVLGAIGMLSNALKWYYVAGNSQVFGFGKGWFQEKKEIEETATGITTLWVLWAGHD